MKAPMNIRMDDRAAPVRPALIALAMLLGAGLASVTAHGDDAELFLGTLQAQDSPANILFVIDTSGSMRSLVATQAPWSAAQNFTGCYDSDSLYFSTTGTIPSCDSGNLVPKTSNACAASAQGFAQLGHYTGLLLAFDESRERWDELTADPPDQPIECEADRGVHGSGSGSGLYAANGPEGPWSTTPAQEPAWTTEYTLYDGNWLNWNAGPPTVEKTRLEVVQDVVGNFVDGLQNVNVGIMRFNESNGGAVIHPVAAVDTARDTLKAVVDGLHAGGATPLSETLYEAALYFMGRPVDFGNLGPVRSVAGCRVGNDPAGTLYRSPITDACSRNFIILLTDGEPAEDQGADALIRALPGFGTLVGADCDGTGDGRCLDDLAEYLRVADLRADLDGPQTVTTHTIGFTLDLPLLEATARRGGGEYWLADDTASLTRALGGIMRSIGDSATSLAVPAVPVDSFNRSQNLNDVYVPVFQPTDRARWAGNLKKYRLVDGVLTGQNGRPAIDPATGLFATDAFSFWSSVPDGNRVTEGGAASRLPDYRNRRIFTNIAGPQLIAIGNRVDPDNPGLTAARLGVPENERRSLIQWALGRDVLDEDQDGDAAETRRAMGDPFHVQPVAVLYGGPASAPTGTVYVSTNDGYLHAFDTESGDERWAFIPARLLNRLYPLYRNQPSATKQYGLDGQITLHILDDDGQPGISGAERAILIFGMGRGGTGLFALDVTDGNAPQLLWEIDSTMTDFADLGQTWSTPVVARVDIGGTPHTAVLFGGGYDEGQDAGNYRTDTVGNAIYVVDLLTGNRLWSAGSPAALADHDLELPAMQHSIPARLRVLDINGDNLADRVYVGDMGGRLWRFDFSNGASTASFGAGGVLASLGGAAAGGDPPASELRRFYATPDAAPILIAGQLVIALNIGSGYRGHPLDTTIDEAFFSIRDFNFFGGIPTDEYPPPLTIDQLEDITLDPTALLPASAAGWRLRLVQGDGEKVMGDAMTISNTVLFTSFTPGATANACTVGTGINRLYAVSIFDGNPLTNLDGSVDDGPLTVLDRFIVLDTGMAVTGLTRVLTEDELLICAGSQCFTQDELPIGAGALLRRTYWFEDEVR